MACSNVAFASVGVLTEHIAVIVRIVALLIHHTLLGLLASVVD